MNSLFTFFGIKNIELTKVKRKNVGNEKALHEPMKEKTREFLIDFYKPENKKLLVCVSSLAKLNNSHNNVSTCFCAEQAISA